MIRLNSEHRSLMSRRRVPCLDDYLDRINLLLWPRFKVRCAPGSTLFCLLWRQTCKAGVCLMHPAITV